MRFPWWLTPMIPTLGRLQDDDVHTNKPCNYDLYHTHKAQPLSAFEYHLIIVYLVRVHESKDSVKERK